MSDDYTFESARVRLEQIAAEVRKKDTSLEKSLDLLEEGVRLANQCTELIDATQWRSTLDEAAAEGAVAREGAEPEPGDVVVVEEVVIEHLPDGEIVEDVMVAEFVVEGEEDEDEDEAEPEAFGDEPAADDPGPALEDDEADAADSAWAGDPGHDDERG